MVVRIAAVVSLFAIQSLGGQLPGSPFDPPRRTELSPAVVDVPLIKGGDFYFVDVLVNGKPLRFTIETGANFFAVSSRAAKTLGLMVDTVAIANGPPGPPVPVARISTLQLGGATLTGVSALIMPLFDGLGFDGIISLPALHDLLATIDFGGKVLRLERGELPAPNGRDILPYSGLDRGGRVDIPLDVGGVTIPAVIDTRSFMWITLPDSTAAALPLAAPPRSIGRAMGPSLGTFQLRGARLAGDVQIGSQTIHRPALVFRDRGSAIIGAPLLEQLVVTIDQVRHRVRIGAMMARRSSCRHWHGKQDKRPKAGRRDALKVRRFRCQASAHWALISLELQVEHSA
jgi:hypothetical protein